MSRIAKLAAAKLSGVMRTRVAVGRLDSAGRFEPLGTEPVTASVYVNNEGDWELATGKMKIHFEHTSARVVTTVGLWVIDRWLVDALPKGKMMEPGDVVFVDVKHLLPFLEE